MMRERPEKERDFKSTHTKADLEFRPCHNP